MKLIFVSDASKTVQFKIISKRRQKIWNIKVYQGSCSSLYEELKIFWNRHLLSTCSLWLENFCRNAITISFYCSENEIKIIKVTLLSPVLPSYLGEMTAFWGASPSLSEEERDE